ncbi:uncharacterized protein LOC126871980 [Bombus huntii]|uniref:uncharacterized protein LOC126871980 n=1 Tax=Bombus huntii TaxID=85661 RepID=UPI0021AA2046|nr:uncharacterized protein LOC126871980 [Bombus huntii]
MKRNGVYISSTTSSEITFPIRLSNRTFFFAFGSTSSSKVLHVWKRFAIESVLIHLHHTWSNSSSHLEALRVRKFFTFGSASRLKASLYIFTTLGAIVPYNKTMGECPLGYNSLHIRRQSRDNLPPNYVMVSFICPCGQFISEFGLHRYLLYHLTGRTGRRPGNPRTRPYLQLLSSLQAEAIQRFPRNTNEDEEEEEEEEEYSPDR